MKICILGSGIMGTGIATILSQSASVTQILWWGRCGESLHANKLKLEKILTKEAKRNNIPAENLEKQIEKTITTTDIKSVGNCEFYIEAISEDINIKLTLFSEIASLLPDDAIIATNTSSLSVTALAMQVKKPENFLGLHFFNPPSAMKLVEVVKGLPTSELTVNKAISFVESLDKRPVIVNESPGFIVNRMLIPMINEAVSILAEGVAPKEEIDIAMKYGANHPIGPLALADLIGTDICLSIMETLHNETGDPKYRAHPLLRKYVRSGYLGRKTRRGFYEY